MHSMLNGIYEQQHINYCLIFYIVCPVQLPEQHTVPTIYALDFSTFWIKLKLVYTRQICSPNPCNISGQESIKQDMYAQDDSPDMFLGQECQLITYCPPSGRSRPMMRSCGLSRPVYTAKLAGDPEYGWTLVPQSSGFRRKAFKARSWQSLSTWKYFLW